eukprot:tig00020902_g14965.t1
MLDADSALSSDKYGGNLELHSVGTWLRIRVLVLVEQVRSIDFISHSQALSLAQNSNETPGAFGDLSQQSRTVVMINSRRVYYSHMSPVAPRPPLFAGPSVDEIAAAARAALAAARAAAASASASASAELGFGSGSGPSEEWRKEALELAGRTEAALGRALKE